MERIWKKNSHHKKAQAQSITKRKMPNELYLKKLRATI